MNTLYTKISSLLMAHVGCSGLKALVLYLQHKCFSLLQIHSCLHNPYNLKCIYTKKETFAGPTNIKAETWKI
uniref:Uncharacterized protein n=1 Tax=Arundo donax TaxID=35708 RepID=A0A0A9AJZ2_ARUDO